MTRAQDGQPCQLALRVETADGPSATDSYDGALEFSVASDGTLTGATVSTPEGALSVSGFAVGRAIDLRITLSDGRFLNLSGAGDAPIVDCPAAMGGLMSGPQLGDIGGWTATNDDAPDAPALAGTSVSGSSTGASCQPPQTPCGTSCCADLATCLDAAAGLCSCPDGTEQCGNRCVPSCLAGQSLDLDTCLCPPLQVLGDPCAIDTDCDSGFCGNGVCTVCNGLVCSGFGCIDPTRNSQNCGECGNICVQPEICIGGFCFCSPNGAQCTFAVECCSKVCYNNTCTVCSSILGVGNIPLAQCGDSCAELSANNYHCGACFNQCINSRCLYGQCINTDIDPNNCGSYSLKCGPNETCILGKCIITSQ